MAQERIEVPLTGKVISVSIKAGDSVKEGDTLCILESMKMENPVMTPVSGAVTEIGVTEGQVVQAGDLIATIEY